MNFALMLEQGPVVMAHVAAAFAAFGLGLVVLFRRKGDALHRLGGRVWVFLMVMVAGTSLFIHEIRTFGPFSPIHILSVYVLIAVPYGVYAVRNGNLALHMNLMKQNFFWGMVVAGAFTFLPHRLLAHVAGDGLFAKAMPFVWVSIPLIVYLVHQRFARPLVSVPKFATTATDKDSNVLPNALEGQ